MNSTAVIIGGGISGLICAIELEKAGVSCTLIEKEERVGGRVKSDVVDGVPLDYGFQVLLTAYPEARRYLNYNKLDLKTFVPGALLHTSDQSSQFGDPLRGGGSWFNTLFGTFATLKDGYKMWRLSSQLKRKSLESIFNTPNQTTLDYLKSKGFSDKVIQNFFKPFFGGIFLEKELKTSARMFELVFKMFSEGHAAIPALGMGAIPGQLVEQLQKTAVLTNTRAQLQADGSIAIDGGKSIQAQFVIEAFAPPSTDWEGSHTFYFEMQTKQTSNAIIHLWAGEDRLINSWHFLDGLWKEVQPSVVSATVVNDKGHSGQELIDAVQRELEEILKVDRDSLSLLKHYAIPHSLPQLEPRWDAQITPKRIGESLVYTIGDHQYFGSLQAAMMSGRRVAEDVVGRM